MTKINASNAGTHAASFRISEGQYQEFVTLLGTVPGSDTGSMYREIFARGLKALQAFYGVTPSDRAPQTEGGQR